MKKIFNVILGFCITLTTFVSCMGNNDSNSARYKKLNRLLNKDKIVKFAVAGSDWADSDYLDGIYLAQEQINENGGILGAKLEVDLFDDKRNPEDAMKVAYEIVDKKEHAVVVGHVYSEISIVVSKIYGFFDTLMFTPLCTSCDLSSSFIDNVYRNVPTDDDFSKGAAKFFGLQGWKNVVIYEVSNEYGRGAANAFELECNEYDIVIQARESFDVNQRNLFFEKTAKGWIQNYNFDAVFIVGDSSQLTKVIPLLRKSGVNQPIVSIDAFDNPIFFENKDNLDENECYVISSFNEESTNKAFIAFKDAYIKKYDREPDSESLHGYDAVKVLAKAITDADSLVYEDIVKALHSSTWDEGAGPYSFNQSGDIEGLFVVKKSQDGQFKFFCSLY